MKVTASKTFNTFRNMALGLDIKDYRDLQAGKVVDVKPEIVKKCKDAYKEVKGAK